MYTATPLEQAGFRNNIGCEEQVVVTVIEEGKIHGSLI